MRLPLSAVPLFFFFNDPPTPEIYTLSLHDALPISSRDTPPSVPGGTVSRVVMRTVFLESTPISLASVSAPATDSRSEEHTSELQSPYDLVCRLLLEKKKQNKITTKAKPDS